MATTTAQLGTYDDWDDEFIPMRDEHNSIIQHPTFDSLPEGIDIHNVWAIVEGEDECFHEFPMDSEGLECECDPAPWVILPGYHLVNVCYFAITANPWADGHNTQYIWD